MDANVSSLDFLSWTRSLFKLYGLNLRACPPYQRYHKRVININIKLFLVRAIFFTSLSLRVYKLTHIDNDGGLIDISMILSIISVIITHIIISKNHSNICQILSSACAILTQSQREKIQKFDKRINLITIAISIIEYAILSLYSAYEGPFEAMLMVTGFKMDSWRDNPDSDSSGSFIIVQIVLASVSYRFIGLMVSHIYYIVVQYVGLLYAESVNDAILYHAQMGKKISVKSIKTLIKLIEFYNDYMDSVNRYIGIIPFFLMASFFAHISSGTAHVILHSTNFKLFFMIIILSTLIIWFLLMTLIMIELASRSHDIILRSKRALIKILSQTLTDNSDAIFIRLNPDNERLKASLLIYVCNLSVTPSLAFSMFVINRSLILKFTSSIVPLTVMIIETSVQINISNGRALSANVSRDAN